MAGNDSFTDLVKQSLGDETNVADRFLITQERTEKLELIIHLVSKLTQAIIVCGPEGIGKTTLLKALQERGIKSWHYCSIMGNADLNFDKIQLHITNSFMQVNADKQPSPLAMVFEQLESQHKKVVLLIDDAGFLIPGLINKILDYAATTPILSVILALTHDDLYLKNSSDNAIDTALIVEVPPLSEKQCGDFLQYLSKKNRARVLIDDSGIEAIYRQTHGIPGRIIDEAPVLANAKKGDHSLWILIAAVVGLVAIALGVQGYSSAKNNAKELPMPIAVEKSPRLIAEPAF